MIFLYAVDPALAADWKALRYVLSHGGMQHARLLMKYPKTWFKQALAVANQEGWAHGKCVEELWARHKASCFVRPLGDLPYDPETTWLDNALAIEGHIAPRAIIVPNGQGHSDERVLEEDELDGNELWLVESSVSLERNAQAFEEAFRVLVLCCRKLTIVEPHFDPAQEKWRSVLEALFRPLADANRSIEIEFHLKAKATQESFGEQCEQSVRRRIPTGQTVRFVRWEKRDQEDLHDRHLLTELGGVSSGWGFDARHGSTTSVHSFDTRHMARLQAMLSQEGGAFDFADELLLEGTG